MRVKTFSTHVVVKKCHVVRKMAGFAHVSPGITFERQARAETEDGAGIGSRKEGTHSVGRTGGILRSRPGRMTRIPPHLRCKVNLQECKVFLQYEKGHYCIITRKPTNYKQWHKSGKSKLRPDERYVHAEEIGRLALMESPGQNR